MALRLNTIYRDGWGRSNNIYCSRKFGRAGSSVAGQAGRASLVGSSGAVGCPFVGSRAVVHGLDAAQGAWMPARIPVERESPVACQALAGPHLLVGSSVGGPDTRSTGSRCGRACSDYTSRTWPIDMDLNG